MALAARMEIRQGTSLVITPQLQQAIKLLQLSNIELDAFVEGELERNPLLVRDEGEADPDAGPAAETSEIPLDQGFGEAAGADLDAPTAYDEASPGERAGGEAPARVPLRYSVMTWSSFTPDSALYRSGKHPIGTPSSSLSAMLRW